MAQIIDAILRLGNIEDGVPDLLIVTAAIDGIKVQARLADTKMGQQAILDYLEANRDNLIKAGYPTGSEISQSHLVTAKPVTDEIAALKTQLSTLAARTTKLEGTAK